MCKRKQSRIQDETFDALLEHSIPDLPPEDVVKEVTPWKRSMNRVFAGLTLTTVTLNLFYLNYLLPTIGTVLLLLGYRSLRRENRWFQICFWTAVIQSVHWYFSLILNTTIWQNAILSPGIKTGLTILSLLLRLSQYFGLWRGFLAVQKKAGIEPHAKSAVALILWAMLLFSFSLLPYVGMIVGMLIIVGYIFIIYNLQKLSRELDEAGYAIRIVPTKFSNRCVALGFALVLTLGCTCGYLFGGSYPMNWTPANSAEHTAVEETKAHLKGLGFPEYVLNDLQAEEIAACEGALEVVIKVSDEPANNGRTEITEYWKNGRRHIRKDTVYDVKELRITNIGVKLPGEPERWVLFHHFLWTVDPGFYGTESIQIWPAYKDLNSGWRAAGDISGRILYDNDGETFVADYYYLDTPTYTSNSILDSGTHTTDIFAAFSMPREGNNHRGYVTYSIDEIRDGYLIDSWFNYTHQQSWLQYPVATAMDTRMKNPWNIADVFKTIQTVLQH